MSRTIKSALTAFALVLSIGLTVSAAENYFSADVADAVNGYFANVDARTDAALASSAEKAKTESETYLTLGELDLSTIRNVLRRTAPLPSGLPTSDDTPAVPVTYAAPVAAAPVYYAPAAIVSSSTDADCLPCQKRFFRRR